MRISPRLHHAAASLVTALCAASMCLGIAACGSGNSSSSVSSSASASSSASSTKLNKIAGVTATGDPGKKPTVKFHTPMTVQDNTYAVLQQGNGATIKKGDRLCAQGIALNAKDGSQIMSTWEKNTPDCSIVVNKSSTNTAYYDILKGQKVNTTMAFGVNDQNSSGTSYLMVLTIISRAKALTRAEGKAVTDIPANLPKVTLASNGKPSLDLNGYKPDGKLVAQTLIKGDGAAVKATQTVDAQYSGWYADSNGTLHQFDSSWNRGSSAQFSLSQVITGWKNGLTGQTIGSQVLLVIPPDQGYGSTDQTDSTTGKVTIPANSTLYFVVDILYAY